MLPAPTWRGAPIAQGLPKLLPLLGERVRVRGTAAHDYSGLTRWKCRRGGNSLHIRSILF